MSGVEEIRERLSRRLWEWGWHPEGAVSPDGDGPLKAGYGHHMGQMLYRLPRDGQTDEMRRSIQSMLGDLHELLDMLARARAEGAREALEAAARDWQCGEGFTLMARPSQPPAVPAIDYAQRTLDWLRARAASSADLGEEGRCPSRCGRNDPCPDPWHDRPTPTVPVSRESEENHDG